jgi:signal transduction histidine kinase
VTDASSVLASVGDAVIALDDAGQVILWSRGAELLFRRPGDEVKGRRLAALDIGWPDGEIRDERRLTLRRSDGRAFSAVVNQTELADPDGGPGGRVLVVKDLEPWIGPVDDVAEPVEGLDVEERLGATFRGVMEATGADFDPGESIDQLARRLAIQGRRLLPGAECMIAVVPPEHQDTFLCLGGAGAVAEQLVGRVYPLEGSIAGRAIAAERPWESIRMDQEGADPGLLASAGVRTLRAVPLLSRQPLPDGRTALGALTVLRREAVHFSADECRLIDDFGALVTLSIQRAEFRLAADRSMERLQLAIDVALDLAQSLDVRDVVRRLVRRSALGSRADRCVLLRIDGADTVVEDAFDVAGHGDLAGYRQAVSAQELMAKAMYTRAPVLGGRYDLSAMPALLRDALQDVRHTATLPLLYGGEVVAILVLSRRADPPFGREELDTLRLLGGPAALALRNSFLYAQTHEAGRVKSDFLDMAAHELRSPLTVIGGYLSMLREDAFGPAPAAWAVPLQALELKVAELTRLVEDLLMAARLETGRLASVIEAVDLGAAAQDAAAAAPEQVRVLSPKRPVRAQADRLQLQRILDHLVGNGLAYTRSGEPASVSLQVSALEASREARLTVEDRGRGISPVLAERIFERFQRVEDPDQPAVPGTGLGLYIARELAERYGGRVELEWTEPGQGSRFALHLPLASDA